jgi:hypothetical protein
MAVLWREVTRTLIEAEDEPRFEPAAVRWAGRLALETPVLTLGQLQLAIAALDHLPDDGLRATLCRLASLPNTARRLLVTSSTVR